MQKEILVVFVALFMQVPFIAAAGPIVRTGDTVSVDAVQTLEGDFYGFGSDISISGEAKNDSYLFGGNVTVNAPTAQDLSILGGMVQVHGTVGDDVRVVGGEVTIAEPVKDDVVVLGGTLTILSTATIEGDVLFYGETLKIDGAVTGSVFGAAQIVRINNTVGGDISLRAYDSLTLGDNAQVEGSVSYSSSKDIVRAQGAEVQGEIHKLSEEPKTDAQVWRNVLMQLVVYTFAVSILYVLAPRRISELAQDDSKSFGMHGLIGLSLFLVLPIFAIISLASVIGLLFGILLFLVYLVFLLTALLVMPVIVGVLITEKMTKQKNVSFVSIALGVLSLFVIALIPYVGGIALFAFFAIACGRIGYMTYSALRS